MQRSEGRSVTANTPTMAENQLSESQQESRLEVSFGLGPSICTIKACVKYCMPYTAILLYIFQGASIQPLPSHFVDNRLLFHPNCGSHAAVINNGLCAHRPNAADDFNFGVVLTSRPLKPNEVFEVRLDKMVTKWTGSIEIGVTTHSPNSLEFPSTMTNVSFIFMK